VSERRTGVTIAALVAVIGLIGAACSGEEAQSPSSSTATTTAAPDPSGTGPLDYPAYRDPAQRIYVALSRRFALRFDSEPTAGFSWRLTNTPDPGVVVPIGTEFRGETTGTAIGGTVAQYISFAASGTGDATIEVRYLSPSGAPAPDTDPMVFHVTVTFTGEPPPLPESGTTLPG
jgi:predicted secreted protein